MRRGLYLLVCLCALGTLVSAQEQGARKTPTWAGLDLLRLQRLRPLPPFDTDGDYRLLDALTANYRAEADTLKPSPMSRLLSSALLGYELRLGRRWSFLGDGLVDVFKLDALDKVYNQHEGSWIGYEFVASYHLGLGRKLVLRTNNNYTMRTQRWMTENRLLYFYNPHREGVLVLAGGRTPRETTHLTNEELFTGSNISQVGANGLLNHYIRSYASVRNSLYLSRHLRTNLQLLYEYRKPHDWYRVGESHQALLGELSLYYDFATPATAEANFPSALQTPIGFFAPEVGVLYRVALDPTRGRARVPMARYHLLELSMRYAYAFDDANRLQVGAVAGGYLSTERMWDADERSMPRLSIAGREPLDARWATLPKELPLGRRWLWAYADYRAGRLALARLLAPKFLDEAIHLRGLRAESGIAWYELGYSIGLGDLARVGVFVGNSRVDFLRPALTLRFSLPFLLLTGSASSRY